MRLSLTSLLLVLALANPVAAGDPSGEKLTFFGLGHIRVGMSAKEIAETGPSLGPGEGGSDDCYEAPIIANPKITLMFESGRLTRIDVFDETVKTWSGVGIGTTEADAKRVYGAALAVEDHKYVDDGHYLIVKSRDGKHAVVMETDGKRVTTIRAGFIDSALYVEGCL